MTIAIINKVGLNDSRRMFQIPLPFLNYKCYLVRCVIWTR